MSYSRKLQSVKCAVVKSLIIILLGMTSLVHAGNQVAEVEARQNAIQQHEESGDYGAALEIARNSYEYLLRMGLSQQARNLAQTVERLEKELLTFGSSRLLFDENNQPRGTLLELLQVVGMEPLNTSEKAIVQINNWAQKNLLRQGERWQEQTSRFEELQAKITPLLNKLGFLEASYPHFKEYQGAIVHGALLPRVRLRLHYLIEQWNQGVRFPHLYFLSGERPLEAQYENQNSLMDDNGSLVKIRKGWVIPLEFPKTESEMIQLVWEQSEIPEDMRREVEVHFITAPMKKDPKSEKLLRPTTDDTVETWLKVLPPQGRYLAITNAPYINRQDLVVRSIAPSEYGFDTVGPGSSEQEKTAIFLDELARFIFHTKQLSEK